MKTTTKKTIATTTFLGCDSIELNLVLIANQSSESLPWKPFIYVSTNRETKIGIDDCNWLTNIY